MLWITITLAFFLTCNEFFSLTKNDLFGSPFDPQCLHNNDSY